MAINAVTNQFLVQQGLLRLVDPSHYGGPEGPNSTGAFWLVPTSGYFGTQRAPHAVSEDLKAQKFDTTEVEGVEYYLVPEESSNLPGTLSHYAQRTGVAELQNPSGGGVNRVRETFVLASPEATVAPDHVSKYVEENDAWEEARQKKSAEEEQVNRAVSVSPAREPSEGKLVIAEPEEASGAKRGSKASTEKKVESTGDTKAG